MTGVSLGLYVFFRVLGLKAGRLGIVVAVILLRILNFFSTGDEKRVHTVIYYSLDNLSADGQHWANVKL